MLRALLGRLLSQRRRWLGGRVVLETLGEGSPYITRLTWGRARLHVFHRGDGDPDPHDHPWAFWTLPLTSYVDEVWVAERPWWVNPGHPDKDWPVRGWLGCTYWVRTDEVRGELRAYLRVVRAGRLHYRPASYVHRVLGRWAGDDGGRNVFRTTSGRIVTLVLREAGARDWGFYKFRDGRLCWVPWREYVLGGGRGSPCSGGDE